MIPLAERMRPKSLNEYIGQEHLTQTGAVLAKAIEKNTIPSMILWGPPGVGKTTLAFILANSLSRQFYHLSAINSGVKEVRAVIETARQHFESVQQPSILFIDEIHRFSKSQQDSLLGAVEKGIITLVGATTENPSFEVISPLLSRCQVYILKALTAEHLRAILYAALANDTILKEQKVVIKEDDALLRFSGGDARKLLNLLELVIQVNLQEEIYIDNKMVELTIHQKMALYDKTGEQHYDLISAFIKSIRGSDPNAAVYWLARMIHGGEDPLFIARRMLILASEDIGNANPNAMLIANQCFDAAHKIGFPECRIILSQAAIYLACSPKSNSSYMAIEEALELVAKTGDLAVPLHLRNAPTNLMKEIGYGKDYAYAHNYDNNFVKLNYLPEQLKGKKIYVPGKNNREAEFQQFLKTRWENEYDY
jgi:putative ATPase